MYGIKVLMDCPRCGEQADLVVNYEIEVKHVNIDCPNHCELTADQRSTLEEEGIALANEYL